MCKTLYGLTNSGPLSAAGVAIARTDAHKLLMQELVTKVSKADDESLGAYCRAYLGPPRWCALLARSVQTNDRSAPIIASGKFILSHLL